MLDQLLEHLHRRPFVPFWIVMTSGDRFEVADRHSVAIGLTMLHCFYPRSDRSASLRIKELAAFETRSEAA